MKYTMDRVPAFVNAFGPLDDVVVACGAGAIALGFPVITNETENIFRVPKSLIVQEDVSLSLIHIYLMGQGYTMKQAMDEVQMVVEGVYSAKAAKALAEKYNVEMPIIMEVNKLLFENKPASEAVKDLMQREKQGEISWEL